MYENIITDGAASSFNQYAHRIIETVNLSKYTN